MDWWYGLPIGKVQMTYNNGSGYALNRLLCAKAASALKNLEQMGMIPDTRLMAAVNAKLDYLEGSISAEQLEEFFSAAEQVKLKALQDLNDPSTADKDKSRIMFYAADAAACAASNEPVRDDVDDPIIEEMLERFLLTGKY